MLPLVEFDKWHSFAIYAKGNAFQFFIDDKKVTDYWDKEPILKGTALIIARGHVLFDDIVIQELR